MTLLPVAFKDFRYRHEIWHIGASDSGLGDVSNLLVSRSQPRLKNTLSATSFACTIWLRHQMETFSALLALCAGNSPVTGDIPVQRPVTRSFGVFFDLRLNKRLGKQSWGWWFRRHRAHYDVTVMTILIWFSAMLASQGRFRSLWHFVQSTPITLRCFVQVLICDNWKEMLYLWLIYHRWKRRNGKIATGVAVITQRGHDAMLTPLLRQNDVAMSFWRNNDVIIMSCVCWERFRSTNSNYSLSFWISSELKTILT